ncbi:uncharacterized protein LOC129776365 [Toxorhynchites rutilus septentrionalis]|uniref:uncharacterized protein LOC129776365 n=1 Tax=Toxorhynchites rutilus septentrionalis TaxID=329112 RepID=UPI002479DB6E|nr:uncharacterized protein LOC129776365 [Toxorhynchites rutilus septentrionalis]
MQRLHLAGLLAILNLGISYAYLEPVLSVCKRNDPELDKCIADVVERIRPNLASGKYGSANEHPKIEPIIFEKMRIDRGPSFSANFSNLAIRGASKFVLKKLRTNAAENSLTANVILPTLDVLGKYVLNMNILVLRIAGQGDVKATLNNTKAILRLEYFKEKINDKDTFRFRPVDVKIKFDKAQFYLSNLFNGDPTLERVGNDAINANPHVLLDEVKQSFEENLSDSFTKLGNSLLRDIDAKEFFPED